MDGHQDRGEPKSIAEREGGRQARGSVAWSWGLCMLLLQMRGWAPPWLLGHI